MTIKNNDFCEMIKIAMYTQFVEDAAGPQEWSYDKYKQASEKTKEKTPAKKTVDTLYRMGAIGLGVGVGTGVGDLIGPKIKGKAAKKLILYGSPIALGALAYMGRKALEDSENAD